VSQALKRRLCGDVRPLAVLALQEVLKHRRGLEIAHQQIVFRGLHIAFSTRVTESGRLYVDLDLGDPTLADRLILECELKTAGNRIRQRRGASR